MRRQNRAVRALELRQAILLTGRGQLAPQLFCALGRQLALRQALEQPLRHRFALISIFGRHHVSLPSILAALALSGASASPEPSAADKRPLRTRSRLRTPDTDSPTSAATSGRVIWSTYTRVAM